MQILANESVIENAACKVLLKEFGARALKLNVHGYKGWPDRLVIIPNTRMFFIEFKRPKGRLSKIQEYIIKNLRKNGHAVYVCKSVKEAVCAAKKEIKNAS